MALEYAIALPASPAKDLAARELHVTRGDGPESVVVLPPESLGAKLRFERGEAVAITLVDVDTSGNRSLPSPTLAFTAIDSIPPPAPGPLAVSSVTEAD